MAAGTEGALPRQGDVSRSGWRAEGSATDEFVLRAATVVGVRHRLAGDRAEDAFAWAHHDGRIVVAVADGVGSQAGSADAALRAVQAAVQRAVGPDQVAQDAVLYALDAANDAATAPEGGATTLVVAVIDKGGAGWVGRVGDSTAFVVEATGSSRELFAPPDPDRAGTATAALPAEDPAVETVPVYVAEESRLVLVSDGVADPWRDGPTTVAPGLVDGLLARPDPVALLQLADFSRHGCHDDRTILCVWRQPAIDEEAQA